MGKAVSSLIATVLVTAIGTIGLIVTMALVGPIFSSAKSTTVVNSAFQNLETLNTAVKGIASETQGSKRTISLSVSDGVYKTNSTYDWLYFEYEPEEALPLTGTKGSVEVVRGLEFADYFNWYVDGSKATPTWTNMSGQWTVSDYKYSGQSGLSYRNVSGPLENWKFSASISNVSGPTGGQVFVLPTNPESLVGFWPFDNRSGSVAYDYSSNRNNATLTLMNTTGNATSGWQTSGCKSVGCMRFDGVNDYIVTPSFSIQNASNQLTFSFWVITNGQTSTTASYDSFFADASQSGTIGFLWSYRSNNTNNLNFQFANGTNSRVATSANYFSGLYGDWIYVTITADYSNHYISFYKNGAIVNTVNFSEQMLFPNASIVKYIGSYSSSNNYKHNGTMDEFMIFNRSLPEGEIKALYEMSTKKLAATGTQTITTRTNVSIVLANPAGSTKFDDVTVTRERNELTMLVAYDGIDINGTLRVGKGEHRIEIRHMGVNTTSNRAIIQITAV